MRPLIRCKWGDGCRSRGDGGCTYVHPDESDYQQSRESRFGKRSDVETAYLAETKTRSFNKGDKTRQRPQSNVTGANTSSMAPGIRRWGDSASFGEPQAHSSSGDMRRSDGAGGSHSRSNSGGAFGAHATSGGGGWPVVGQRRTSGQAPDIAEASTSPSNPFPTSWDSTPALSGSTSSFNDPSDRQAGSGRSPPEQSSGGWGISGWSTAANDSSTDNGQQAGGSDVKTRDNPWASSAGTDSSFATTSPWVNVSDAWGAEPPPSNVGSNEGVGNEWDSGARGGKSAAIDQPASVPDRVKGKGKARDDVEMSYRPAGYYVPPAPASASASWPTPSTSAVIPSKPPLPTRKPRVSSKLVPAEMKTPAVPLPTRREITAPIQEQMKEILLKKESGPKQKPHIRPTDYYKGPEGRQRLYAHLIRVMITTVSIYSRKKNAETRYDQVKAMTASPQYGRGTRKTREILNTTLAEAKRNMTTLQNTLTENLEELAIIPDFSEDKPPKRDPRKLMHKVIGYTKELQEWFQGLELEDRTTAEAPVPPDPPEKEVSPQEEKSRAPPPISVPSIPSSSALTPRDLYERGDWTWQEVKDSLLLIQTRLQEVDEEMHSALYTTFNDEQAREDLVNETDAMIEDLTRHLEIDEDEEAEEEDGEVEDEQAREASEVGLIRKMEHYRDCFANTLSHIYQANEEVDNQFRNDIVELSQLVRTSNDLKHEILAWRTEREKLEHFCEEANGKLVEIELWSLEAAVRLQALKEKAEQLVSMKNEITKAEQSRAVTPEFDMNALVHYIRPLLMQRVEQEVQPALQGLQNATRQHQEDMIVKIDQLVQPAIQSTNDLCTRVIAARDNMPASV